MTNTGASVQEELPCSARSMLFCFKGVIGQCVCRYGAIRHVAMVSFVIALLARSQRSCLPV